uniref:Uncharacterized protein n=1 Tax=Arundo donax TaxID=35708 RepID=A0A0A9GBG9_ARUDO
MLPRHPKKKITSLRLESDGTGKRLGMSSAHDRNCRQEERKHPTELAGDEAMYSAPAARRLDAQPRHLLLPLRAPDAALDVQQLPARLLLLGTQPRHLPHQRLPVPPQPLHLSLTAIAGRRHRRGASGPAAAMGVGVEVALPVEEVAPVRAHLAESQHTIARTHTNSLSAMHRRKKISK